MTDESQPQSADPANTDINTANMINKINESPVNTINTVNKPNKKTFTFALNPDVHTAGKLFAQQIGLTHSELVDQALLEYIENHKAELNRPINLSLNYRPKQPGELNEADRIELITLKQDLIGLLNGLSRQFEYCKKERTEPSKWFLQEKREDLKKKVTKAVKFSEKKKLNDPELKELLEKAEKCFKDDVFSKG